MLDRSKVARCFRAALCSLLVASSSQAGQQLTLLAERSIAPNFELRGVDGRRYRLSDYAGRVVVVNFWATWCPPCREEMPAFQRAWEQLRPFGVEILAVNVGEDEDTIFQFTAAYPVEFPLLVDERATVAEAWPVVGLPTTFVVDTKGRLAYRAVGLRAWDDEAIVTLIRDLSAREEGESD